MKIFPLQTGSLVLWNQGSLVIGKHISTGMHTDASRSVLSWTTSPEPRHLQLHCLVSPESPPLSIGRPRSLACFVNLFALLRGPCWLIWSLSWETGVPAQAYSNSSGILGQVPLDRWDAVKVKTRQPLGGLDHRAPGPGLGIPQS